MTESGQIRASDIITSETAPAGISIPAVYHEIYDTIKRAEAPRGLQGAYLAGPMFEDLKAGGMPFYMRLGLHYPDLAEKLGIALDAKYAPASSYRDIEDNAEIVNRVKIWAALNNFPFELNLSDLFYAKANGVETPYAQTSGLFEGKGFIHQIDFTISEVMPTPREIMSIHAERPTSAIVYDFERAVFHYHRDTEKNLYQRNPEGFADKPETAAERGAKIGLRVIK